METTYSQTLEINKLSQAQFTTAKTAGTLDANALYLTPEQPLVITINGGTTEGTNKFTYDGSTAVTANISTSTSDTKVTQAAAITTNSDYPIILGYSSGTTSVTNTVNKAANFVFNPSSGRLVIGKNALTTYNATNAATGLLYVNGDIFVGGGVDQRGIYPWRANYSQVGSATKQFDSVYATKIYAGTFYIKDFNSSTATDTTLHTYVQNYAPNNKCGYQNRSADSWTDYNEYPILMKNTTGTDCDAGEPYFTTDVTITPNDGVIKAAVFYSVSDRRLKKNIKEFKPQKSILDLPIVEFDFKDSNKHQMGCIAQDLQEICPEIVQESSNGYLSINESKIVYLLIDEVKKLKAEVEELKTKV